MTVMGNQGQCLPWFEVLDLNYWETVSSHFSLITGFNGSSQISPYSTANMNSQNRLQRFYRFLPHPENLRILKLKRWYLWIHNSFHAIKKRQFKIKKEETAKMSSKMKKSLKNLLLHYLVKVNHNTSIHDNKGTWD